MDSFQTKKSSAIGHNPAATLDKLRSFANRDKLESPAVYTTAIQAALSILDTEAGLIQLKDVPTIIIPDIHARRGMLIDILGHRLEEGSYAGRQIFELLQEGLLNIVCVGDIVHSEEKADWVINDHGDWTAELLDKEMVRSLGAGAMIMYLKLQYPGNFHCLRGNHDDMVGEITADFRKFVGLQFEDGKHKLVDGKPVLTSNEGESIIVRNWVVNRGEGWGQPFLQLWAQFERALPVFAQGTYFVASHYLPSRALSRDEIQDKNRSRDATRQLTSLPEKDVKRDAITQTLENLGLFGVVKHWFHGHRVVPSAINNGRFATSPGGLEVRLNNPENYVFAYVPGSQDKRFFEPERDVYIKKPGEVVFHR